MLDLVSSLVALAIILAFVTPWIRSVAFRNRQPAAGRPVPRGPRDIAESGGFRPVLPARQERAARFPLVERPVVEEASITRRPAVVPVDTVAPITMDGRLVRRALATPESLRTAILLKEIMDLPVSMKEHGR